MARARSDNDMDKPQSAPVDQRLSRGEATKSALMRAGEKLIAAGGIENVTIKQILHEAGQNNKTALQYHFGDMKGLIKALRAVRGGQIKAKRERHVAQLLARGAPPALRDICKLMIAPAFDLAREDAGFRKFIRAFGPEIALSQGHAGNAAVDGDGPASQAIITLLRDELGALDDEIFRFRLDAALRFAAASFVHHAGQNEAFTGPKGDAFLSNVLDALEGILHAPVSAETQRIRGQSAE